MFKRCTGDPVRTLENSLRSREVSFSYLKFFVPIFSPSIVLRRAT